MFGRLMALFLLVGLGYWGYSEWQSSVERRAQETKSQEMAAQIQARITAVAEKHGAVVDWPARLAKGGTIRSSPILTAELQDLWATGRPILFIGITSDIARTTEESVTLSVDYGALDQAHLFLGTNLRLAIRCSRALSDPLLASASNPSRMAFDSDAAVIAVISAIKASSERDTEGSHINILTGIGECVDVVQIPSAASWWFRKSKGE